MSKFLHLTPITGISNSKTRINPDHIIMYQPEGDKTLIVTSYQGGQINPVIIVRESIELVDQQIQALSSANNASGS